MTQNVGSMTRGQGNEILNQIENACKEMGVNPEEITSEFIREKYFFQKSIDYISAKKAEKTKSFVEIKTLTSDGRTGEQFLSDLEKAGLSFSGFTKTMMKGKEFNATVTTGTKYRIAVIKGEEFTDEDRNIANIRNEIAKLGGIMPPAELSPLLRLNFSDEEIKALGLSWIIPVHEPIDDSSGRPELLGLRASKLDNQLNAYYSHGAYGWDIKSGFAFLLPLGTDVLES